MFVLSRSWPALHVAGRNFAYNTYEFLNGIKSNYLQGNNQNHDTSLNLQQGTSHYLKTGYESLFSTVRNYSSQVASRNIFPENYSVQEVYQFENQNAHNLLCSMPEYRSTTLNNLSFSSIDPGTLNNLNFTSLNPAINIAAENSVVPFDENLNKFKWVATHVNNAQFSIDDTSLDNILYSVKENWYKYTFLQVSELLRATAKLNHFMPENIYLKKFIQDIDSLCSGRVSRRWGISAALFIADHWYHIGVSKNLQYIPRIQRHFCKDFKQFSKNNFVQYMFLSNLVRNLGPSDSKQLLSLYLASFDQLSIEEITIVSLAFFKTNTLISGLKLTKKIVEKVITEKETMPEECLAIILKSLRKSDITDKQIITIIHELYPLLPQKSSYVWLNLLQTASQHSIYDEEFLNMAHNLFLRDLPCLRLKDIERSVQAFVSLQPQCCNIPNILHCVAAELRKPERFNEFNLYPHVFTSVICSLSVGGFYALDLVSAVFQPSMHQIIKNEEDGEHYKNPLRATNMLSWSLQMEGPQDFIGFQLDPMERMQITEKYLGRIPSTGSKDLSDHERLIVNGRNLVNSILHPVSSSIEIILPYFSMPDVVFCTNTNGEPVNIPEEFTNQPLANVKVPIRNDLLWNVVIMAGRNHILKPSSLQMVNGFIHQKKRHLQKLGYNVAIIIQNDSIKLPKKLEYIISVLSEWTSLKCGNHIEEALQKFLEEVKIRRNQKALS